MASVRRNVSKAGVVTYSVLYRLGGKQTSTTFEPAPKPAKPEKFAKDFKALVDILGPEKALATIAAEQDESLTVDDLFERWLEWKATTDVTARTLRDYRRDYDNWIRPALGGRQAESVDELDVQELVDSMAGRLDPKSVGDRHMILGGMYRFGVARSRRLVSHNPCLETQLPRKRRRVPKGFTLEQWSRMHDWGRVHEPDADDLLLMLASTGWRFSECTPLTPEAVEDDGDRELEDARGRCLVVPMISVSVLGVHRMDENDRRVYVEGEAKSFAALRRINLPAEAAGMVRRRIVGLGPRDLIFTTRAGKMWRSTNFPNREFQRILDGAGIEKVRGMGPHYLRHTHVAMLNRAGVAPDKIQKRLGHEQLETTLGTYGGMIDNSLSLEELARLDREVTGRPDVVAGQVADVVRGELG